MICLTFPENGGNSDDKLFTKKQKKNRFHKFTAFFFSQSIFKTYFKNVCPDKFLISFVLKAFPHFPRK